MRRFICCLFSCALIGATPALGNLHWRLIGPFRGGRALAVTGVPGQPNHFYFGAVDGGVWESTNAGRTWDPIFDNEPVASIGSIAVAPSNAQTIYLGTGEADMRSDIAYGNGMYKSEDGGKTWRHSGLDDTRQIGSIVVDPRNADVAYVAALGHQYGPNAERGVFKTSDGGKSWSKVLYKDENTGATALAMDPSDPNVIYAALWQTRRPPWNVYPPSNGPGSGLYKSTDAGATWKQLTNGLPAHVGRIGLSISAAAPKRVYANVDSDSAHGGIYRSDDGGTTWTRTSSEQRLWQRGWYFMGITADPRDPDVVYVMNTATYRSTNGGKTFDAILGDPTGDDYHSLWIDPSDSNRMVLGSDQGVIVSVDRARTWSSWYNQPTAQFYHVITDNHFPYRIYGAQQDSGAAMTPSRSKNAEISNFDFHAIDVGGESGTIAPDPRDADITYGGTVTKERIATGWEQNVDPTLAYPDTLWRSTWTLPIAFSPADPTALYFSHQRIFRTRDGGQTWVIISPDLTRANEGTPSNLDPATLANNNGITRHGVVYAIAPSPLRAGQIWAGTDDGYVWVTNDGGGHWKNVTPAALTAWSKVGIIDASHFDTRTAYIAVDRHRLDDLRPYIYRTHDGGGSWTAIVNGIPDGSFVNVVREDPRHSGLLYAGTEKGIYVSFDDGANWQSLQRNLPVTSIRDIAFRGNDIVVATHGRSFWALDDAVSLPQMNAFVNSGSGSYLFAPGTTYRIRPGNDEGTFLPLDEPQADNPPSGLNIDYVLGTVNTAVVIDVLAPYGGVIRHFSSADKPKPIDPQSVDFTTHWIAQQAVPSADPGAHRFTWDFHASDRHGPLVPPGTYTIRLTVDGKSTTRPATLLRDPRISASNADLRAQYELASSIAALRDDADSARKRALDLASKVQPNESRELRAIAGEEPPSSPDDSVGSYSHDFTSFLFVTNALDNLEGAVESADAAPTADMRTSFRKLSAIYHRAVSRLTALTAPT